MSPRDFTTPIMKRWKPPPIMFLSMTDGQRVWFPDHLRQHQPLAKRTEKREMNTDFWILHFLTDFFSGSYWKLKEMCSTKKRKSITKIVLENNGGMNVCTKIHSTWRVIFITGGYCRTLFIYSLWQKTDFPTVRLNVSVW